MGKTMTENAEHGAGPRWNPLRLAAWSAAALLLLLPLVAMQFTNEVNWDAADFIIFGALLAGAGLTFELAVRRTGNYAYRFAVGVALAAAFLLVWINGAVGIIGNERNDANLMYFGVLAVGIIGSLIARFRPQGMAYALFATALAQVVVAAVALTAGWGSTTSNWPWDILGLTGFFTAMFVGSALLFRRAGRESAG